MQRVLSYFIFAKKIAKFAKNNKLMAFYRTPKELYVKRMKNLVTQRETARILYLSGEAQKDIAERVGVSAVTINKWVNAYRWQTERAAKSITRAELTNKLLLTINRLIEQVNASDDPKLMESLGDRLSKMSAVVEKLDKKANIVNVIEVFMAFSKWLEYRSQSDPDITPEFLKVLNKYQDKYIMESMSQGGTPA